MAATEIKFQCLNKITFEKLESKEGACMNNEIHRLSFKIKASGSIKFLQERKLSFLTQTG